MMRSCETSDPVAVAQSRVKSQLLGKASCVRPEHRNATAAEFVNYKVGRSVTFLGKDDDGDDSSQP